MISHSRYHMRVGVQGNRYVSVAQKLLDVLRMHVTGEQKRGASVAQIVETDARQLCPRQKRSERSIGYRTLLESPFRGQEA